MNAAQLETGTTQTGALAPAMLPRRVLMIAYHFPPLAGSSGIQRTLRFVQQLPGYGWSPLVLSASPRAYERVSDDLAQEVPPGTPVERAFALDTARHLSLGGRYLGALARPDRWMTWQWDAVRHGMAMIRRWQPQVIWSTYPIATAHLIGAELHRRSGLPWVADFRDPMAQEGYPEDPRTWQQFSRIERCAAEQAAFCTFTTPSACRSYQARYPAAAARMRLLENGYDEGSFASAEATAASEGALNAGCVTLLHSGIVYPSERDPTRLFEALGRLKAGGHEGRLRVRFRAAVHDELLHRLAAQHGVQAMVEVLPPVPYVQALVEMLRADALLLLQASNCNEQVPAKLYEYLRAARPVVCLTDPAGDTWSVLRATGVQHSAALDDAAQIEALLLRLLQHGTTGLHPLPAAARAASRRARAEQLAAWLDEATAQLPRSAAARP